jgi:hypothetical protein
MLIKTEAKTKGLRTEHLQNGCHHAEITLCLSVDFLRELNNSVKFFIF